MWTTISACWDCFMGITSARKHFCYKCFYYRNVALFVKNQNASWKALGSASYLTSTSLESVLWPIQTFKLFCLQSKSLSVVKKNFSHSKSTLKQVWREYVDIAFQANALLVRKPWANDHVLDWNPLIYTLDCRAGDNIIWWQADSTSSPETYLWAQTYKYKVTNPWAQTQKHWTRFMETPWTNVSMSSSARQVVCCSCRQLFQSSWTYCKMLVLW